MYRFIAVILIVVWVSVYVQSINIDYQYDNYIALFSH